MENLFGIESQEISDRFNSITRILLDMWTQLYLVLLNSINVNRKAEYIYQKYKMVNAKQYPDWLEAANALDVLDGYNEWKDNPESHHYDFNLLQSRTNEILQLRKLENDRRSMMHYLKLAVSRNIGNKNNPELYTYARVGTKKLISNYNQQIVNQLHWISEVADTEDEISLKEKYDYFLDLRKIHGRTALSLSGGGALGTFHLGVLRTLETNNLLPQIVSGSSSGSFMASIIGTHTREERLNVLYNPHLIPRGIFNSFEEPNTVFSVLKRLVKNGHMIDPEHITKCSKVMFGELTFAEAYNRTNIILNITISPSGRYDMPRLLNYLVAPDVFIWSAVVASCALPGFLPTAKLYIKDKNGNQTLWSPTGEVYCDGSIDGDIPSKRISEIFNVSHFIVVQVNPHIAPIAYLYHEYKILRKTVFFFLNFIKDEASHRCKQMIELGIFPNIASKIERILSQKYTGNVTISPSLSCKDLYYALSNVTIERLFTSTNKGCYWTWKMHNSIELAQINDSLRVELTIEQIVHKLKTKLLERSVKSTGIQSNHTYSSIQMSKISSSLDFSYPHSVSSESSQISCSVEESRTSDQMKEEYTKNDFVYRLSPLSTPETWKMNSYPLLEQSILKENPDKKNIIPDVFNDLLHSKDFDTPKCYLFDNSFDKRRKRAISTEYFYIDDISLTRTLL